MSVTTTQPSRPGTPPPGGRPGSLFTGRARAVRDDTPSEMLEFYSPSTALQGVMPKLAARNAVALIATMVLLLILVAATFKMDRIVTAGGKVVSMTPELVVQPLNAAIVKTIAVSAGDIVHKGQLLAQLDPTFAAADNVAALDQVDRYQTEIDRLNAENRQLPYRPKTLSAGALVQEGIFAQRASAREAELRYYRGQIDAQRALMSQADADVRQYAKETGVAADVEKMRQQLEHDLVGSRIDTLTGGQPAPRGGAPGSDQRATGRECPPRWWPLSPASWTIITSNGSPMYRRPSTQDSLQLATYRDQLEHAALNYKLIDLRAEQDATVLSVAPCLRRIGDAARHHLLHPGAAECPTGNRRAGHRRPIRFRVCRPAGGG